MKITQEVRDFAAKQAADSSSLSLLGEGDHSAGPNGGGVSRRDAETAEKLTVAEAEAGMEEMSKRFHDEGGEIYLPAAE